MAEPAAAVTVADAAPLIAFARLDALSLLPRVLGEVIVPEAVAAECLTPGFPGADIIAAAFVTRLLARHTNVEPDLVALPQLDIGETAAIQLAQQMQATVLIDERLGRAVARQLGIRVVGSLGVLIAAKRRGHIPSVGPMIRQMRHNGYYIAESLVQHALQRAGE